MISSRPLSTCLLFCLLALSNLADPPTLIFPENKAGDQPAELALSWEAGALTNYFSDGGFEKSDPKWQFGPPWKVVTDAANAAEGTRFAELPIRNNNLPARGEAIILQNVFLPKKGKSARLRWRDYHSSVGIPESRPRFKVDYYIPSSGKGEILYDVACGEGSEEPWNQHELDMSQFQGKTFAVTFFVTNQFITPRTCLARLDDVHLEVIPESVEYEVYLGPAANLGVVNLLGKTADTSWNLSGLVPASTNYWKIIQITDGVRASSPVFQFVVGGSAPVEAPPLLAGLSGGQLHLQALTQPGGFYQFEQTDTPDSDAWQPLGDEITGDGNVTAVDVPLDAEARFFRIRVTR